jgi:putative resolvase
MNQPIPISAAAKALGVSTSTLRRWERSGKPKPARTVGGQRRYNLAQLQPRRFSVTGETRKSIAYARVSSHNQKADLERQKQVLELYCASQGWTFEVVAGLGSRMNYQKKGLKKLLDDVLADKIERLVLAHQESLLHFGAELVFAICQAKDVEVVIINHGENTSFEQELAGDVLEIITVLSATLYGSRSPKHQKLIAGVRSALKEAQCS